MSEEQGARAQLADALADGLDVSIKVVDNASGAVPEVDHDVVLVALDEVKPGPVSGSRTVVCSVLCAVAKTKPGVADDALEDLLGQVLTVLDGVAWCDWRSAKRAAYKTSEDGPEYPAFTIEIEINVRTS